MKRVLFFLAVFLAFIPSALAGELVVEKFSGGLSREVSFMSEKAANKEFAGYTYTFKRSSGLATKSRKSIPFSGTVVAYFAPNHAVYVWAKGESKVITGYWGVFEANGPDSANIGNLLCFDFTKTKEKYQVCPIIKRYSKYIHERTKGNPFKLRKGGKVPKVVKKHNRSLKKTLASL